MISSMFAIAWGFSIFAIIRGRRPAGAAGGNCRAEIADIIGGPDKRQGHKIDVALEPEFKVLYVFFREGRRADGNAGEVDPLVGGEASAHEYFARHIFPFDLQDFQTELPVVEKYVDTGLDVMRKAFVRRGDPPGSADERLGSDDQFLPLAKVYRRDTELADADLRSLKVLQDGHLDTGPFNGPMHILQCFVVLHLCPVGEIEPHDPHPRCNQVYQRFGG